MAFPNIINIDELAAPISEDQPTGSDIREDRSPTSDYYTIKDSRNSARAAERSAMFDDSDADLLAPWHDVAKCAEKILSAQSKDLEVATWYTEALIRLHGFPGLRDGFALIERLVKDHWDGLYPEPDEDGLETKVAPLTGLNGDGGDGTLMMPVRNAPITPESDYGAYSFFQYQQARDADRIADDDAKAARLEVLGYSFDEIEQCVNAASNEWAQDLVETLEEALVHYKSISEELRSSCGHDAPPFTNITTLLDEVLRTTRFVYKSQLEALAASAPPDAEAGASEGGESSPPSGATPAVAGVSMPTGPVASREDALKLLEAAAKYFRTYEPHTPLAPGLERLIGWGRMTVSELMAELLPDDQSRSIYSQLTGVKLDGSDTQRYVAPPPAARAPQAPTAPASAETPEASSGQAEWSEESQTADAGVGW
ncbi:type VI secretion system protein TssA [Microbulbifer rhizosphaerae]|uniref:Type VI secretion system protein ImpA n=1 Tax=Microbulbifer rhizosphaerae TaxID=1562603 RepID=A0A7W4WC33_9GAMM|nr:type VI secretion system protein TssA [Microbulbifer rhizosphaerae]MBB3060952.1 type VI secretion system protein ImpA [Microbulbifer rhizosphaerae]